MRMLSAILSRATLWSLDPFLFRQNSEMCEIWIFANNELSNSKNEHKYKVNIRSYMLYSVSFCMFQTVLFTE